MLSWQNLSCAQRYGKNMEVTTVDKEKQTVTLKDGKKIQYDALLSTIPLDITLNWLGQPKLADTLSHRYFVLTVCLLWLTEVTRLTKTAQTPLSPMHCKQAGACMSIEITHMA